MTVFRRRVKEKPLSVFLPSMLTGESAELSAERMERLESGLYGKRYFFQVRNDDGRQYFTDLSRQFPSLRFVLTWDWTGDGEIASCRIHRGRSRLHVLSERHMSSVMAKHGVDFDSDWEGDYGDDQWVLFLFARFELREYAEQWWLRRIAKDAGALDL